MTLKKQVFNHELVSNGKVSAKGMADLRFESGEVIAHIWVKNGDRVQKGQKLAELDKFKLDNLLSQAEDALKNPSSSCVMCLSVKVIRQMISVRYPKKP